MGCPGNPLFKLTHCAVAVPSPFPLPPGERVFESPSLDGRGLGEGEYYFEQASRIASNTPPKFSRISGSKRSVLGVPRRSLQSVSFN